MGNKYCDYTKIQNALVVISFIPIVLLFWSISKNSFNIPYSDDYDAILRFLNDWDILDFMEKSKSLISFHNEHRLLTSRLLYIQYLSIFGNINFKNIILIGNLQLIIIGLSLYYFSLKYAKNNYGISALIISLCVFDFSNYENNLWAMASVANFSVIMFFLLSLMLYGLKNKIFLIPAVLFQILATFSNGNGILACFAIVFYNIIRIDKLRIMISVISSVLLILIYFSNFPVSPNGNSEKNLIGILFFIAKLLGSHFCYNSVLRLIIFSISMFFVIKWSLPIFKENTLIQIKEHASLLTILFFISTTIILLAYFRNTGWNGIGSYTSRYLIYAHLFAIVVFSMILSMIKKNKNTTIILTIITIMYGIGYINNYVFSQKLINKLKVNITMEKFAYPDFKKANTIANKSCAKNIYCIDNNRINNFEE